MYTVLFAVSHNSHAGMFLTRLRACSGQRRTTTTSCRVWLLPTFVLAKRRRTTLMLGSSRTAYVGRPKVVLLPRAVSTLLLLVSVHLDFCLLGSDIFSTDDPQMPGLIPLIKKLRPELPIVYRSHIEIRSDLVHVAGSPQEEVWKYLWNNIQLADLFIGRYNYFPFDLAC